MCIAATLVAALSWMVVADVESAEAEVAEIQQAIAAAGANWTAGVTPFSVLSASERSARCGDLYEAIPDEAKRPVPARDEALPSHFDWSDNGGDWTSPIRDQGSCGSCWDFAATAVFEALLNIDAGNPALDPDLSEQYVLSCCGACGSCGGGYSHLALDFYCTTGGVTEACLPYQADDTVPCGDACTEPHVYLGAWAYVPEDVESIKRAVNYYGPICASFEVYDDFFSYTGGVYEHVWGDYAGGHAISIVGWDDTEQCWICKNSWGADWGESGFFRIGWGECDIEGRRTVVATLGSWPSGVVDVTVLDNTGAGLAGVDIYVNGDWRGTTGAGGGLALDLVADMSYTVIADWQGVFLYDDVVAPGPLVLDCRSASAITMNATKLDGSPLDAYVFFDYRGDLYCPGWISGSGETFYVTPGTYDVQVHSLVTGDEYALFELGLDCTSSCTLNRDTRTMAISTIHIQTVDSFSRYRVNLYHSAFDWSLSHSSLYEGDSLYCSAGSYTLATYLLDDTAYPPYTWYYRYRDESAAFAGGSTLNLQGGGTLDPWTSFYPGHYKQGDAVWIWCGLSDAYGGSFQYVYRYDATGAAPSGEPEGRRGGGLVRAEDARDSEVDWGTSPEEGPTIGEPVGRPSEESIDGGSMTYYDPQLTVDAPSGATVADGVVPLDTWVYFLLAEDAETGFYETTMVHASHTGDLTDVSYFPVDELNTAAAFRADIYGDVIADGTVHADDFQSGNADVAEWVAVSEPCAAGDVLELDPETPGAYRVARGRCSATVAGVVSTAPGVVLGAGATDGDRALLALTGIVPVKVSDEGGPILPGDLLVASSTPGHAMRWDGDGACPCALVGKAMEPMTGGRGLILVLLTAH